MYRCTVAHPYNEILSNDKKEWAIKPYKDLDKSWILIAKWKTLIWKGCILCDSIYTAFCKRKNINIINRYVCLTVIWGEDE